MDLNIHKSFSTDDDIEKIEPEEVWEDCWFFGNLLDRKTRMLRSLSDPCTSSKSFNLPEKSYEETYESIEKLPVRKQVSNLIRASSMSPSVERKDETQTPTSKVRSKSKKKTSSNKLLRAPSLPASLGTEEDEEIEFSMGKLIRQASLNNSNILPPRTHASKSVTPSSSITKQRSRRKQELESLKLETQKSFNDLDQYEELRGFKDLGFGVDKKDLSTNAAVNAIPGSQENKRVEEYDEEEKMKRRPYFSSSSAPPVPKWGAKKSREDMKAQIKFWARAVASNVRQEC
ncbi:hypothetical protein ACJIZ3_007126 [Penstemon smallii]|uniref:Uncharacterized protein n=1 Tax=Penstemon smallii TaxID=265156 RepID=A0ABD3S9V9_9LAMI